jgi:type II secretory pathway predicted ATPase ExeA
MVNLQVILNCYAILRVDSPTFLFQSCAKVSVHEVSFGIPRKIGAVTEAALTYALFDQKRTVTADMVLKVKNLEG